MIDFPTIIKELELNESLAIKYITPIPPEFMAQQPPNLPNHPAWILGHLTISNNTAVQLITGVSIRPESERDLFAIGSTPQPAPSIYPDKQTLVDNYVEMHEHLVAAFNKVTHDMLAAPPAIERLQKNFPTLGLFLLHVSTAHEAYHIGQLACWRQATGLAGT